jgi:hypothetical protein
MCEWHCNTLLYSRAPRPLTHIRRLDTYFAECPEEHRGEIVGELVISASQAGHVDILRCLARHATDDDYLDMSDSAK